MSGLAASGEALPYRLGDIRRPKAFLLLIAMNLVRDGSRGRKRQALAAARAGPSLRECQGSRTGVHLWKLRGSVVRPHRPPVGSRLFVELDECYSTPMLKRLMATIGRFQVFAILGLAIAFAVPAFASHACASPTYDVSISAEAASPDAADDCAGCPDCGPACAGGCCHAPHSGMAADPMIHRAVVDFELTSTWTHVVRAPMTRPSGPERPPRI